MKNPFGLEKGIVLEIVKEVSKKITKADNEVFKPCGIHLSNKNMSEIIGKIMEKTASDILTKKLRYEVKNAQGDFEPDLYFTKIKKAIEIKITSTDNAWTGGEFSKRPFEYLLVSWGKDFDEFFVAFTHLDKKDWHSNMSKNFYGPSYPAKDLYKKKVKTIFLGRLEKTPKGAVKIIRESITSQNQ